MKPERNCDKIKRPERELRTCEERRKAAGRIRQGYRVLARKDGEHYIIRVEEDSK